MYDAELIETKKKVDELLFRKEFSYKTGLKEGYLDAVSDLVNKIKETDDFEYAMFSLGFIKEAAEQLIKEMWDGDISMKKLGAYKQGREDAIDEFAEKIMDIMPNDIDAKVHNGSICLDILALAEQLKEQNK